MSLKTTLMGAAIAASSLALTSAQAGDDVYFQVHGGVNFLTNDDIEGTIGGTAFDTDYDADTGYLVGAALGKRINERFRIEGEVTYRDNEIGNVAGVSVDGDVTSTALMFNGYYDFETDTVFKPYVGAGIGYADLEVGDESDDVFAYQFKAGVSRPLADASNEIGAEISYFGTEDFEVRNGADNIEASYGNTAVSVFYRKTF